MLGSLRNRSPALALVALFPLASAGCHPRPGLDLVRSIREEPIPYTASFSREHKAQLAALGGDVVPVIVEEIDNEASRDADGAAFRICFYLDVVRSLRAHDARESVERLLTRTDDEDVQLGALQALEVIGDRRSCEALRAALRSHHYYVRGTAAWLLARFYCDEAIPDLIARLDDPDERVGEEARLALASLANEDLGDDTTAWRAWWQRRRTSAP